MFRILTKLTLAVMLASLFLGEAQARFIQPDWLEVTKPGVGTNRYAYSFNDPVNKIDPNGNQAISITKSQDERDETHENNAETHDKLAEQLIEDGFPEDDALVQEHRELAAKARSRIGTTNTEIVVEEVATVATAAVPSAFGQFLSRTFGGLVNRAIGRVVSKTDTSNAVAQLSKQDAKAVRSLENRVKEHQAKLADFFKNPTVRPGMENQPAATIAKAQVSRAAHIQREINAFQKGIRDIYDKYE